MKQFRTTSVGMLLVATLLVAPGVARGDKWVDERAAGPVVLHATFSLDQYPGLVKEIASLQEDLESQLGIPGPQEPIHIYLFSSRDVYLNYLRRYFPNVNARRAMFIKGRGPGMVFAYVSNQLVTDVRHESTHALLHSALPMVPLWLDEGLAEYFEVPRQLRQHGNPHQGKTIWAARFGSLPSLQRLEALRTLEDMSAADYRQSWAVVHFLLHGSAAGKQELTEFLSDIAAHEAPGKLSERLNQRVPQLEQKMAEHFRNQ